MTQMKRRIMRTALFALLRRKEIFVLEFITCGPTYMQWTIMTLLYQTLWDIPLVGKGLKKRK